MVSSFMPASALVGLEHLAHAGAALGALVADDHHIAGVDLTRIDGGNGGVLSLSDAGPGRCGPAFWAQRRCA